MTQKDIKEGRINDQLGSQLESLSAQVEANLERGRNAWAEWKSLLADRSTESFHKIDDFTRTRPWQVIGAAMALGYVLGRMIGRD